MHLACPAAGPVLAAQHRPAVTEKSGEREQAGGECDSCPHLAEVGDPGNGGDLAGGRRCIHAERKDSCPATHVVAEPGPDHLGGDQVQEPRQGQAPKRQRAEPPAAFLALAPADLAVLHNLLRRLVEQLRAHHMAVRRQDDERVPHLPGRPARPDPTQPCTPLWTAVVRSRRLASAASQCRAPDPPEPTSPPYTVLGAAAVANCRSPSIGR